MDPAGRNIFWPLQWNRAALMMRKVGVGVLVLLWYLANALLANEVTASRTFLRRPYWRGADVADPAKRWLTAFDTDRTFYSSII